MKIFRNTVFKWQSLKENLFLKRFLTVLSLDVMVKASSTLLLPVYLRLMSQEEYGLFNYISSIIYACSVILNLGLYVPQSKLFHDYKNSPRRGLLFFNIQVIIVAGLCIITIPVYWLGWDADFAKLLFGNSADYESYRYLILLMTITSLFSFMLTNFYYTTEKIAIANRYSVFRILSVNIVSVALLFLYRDSDSVYLRLLSIVVIELLLLTFFYVHYIREMIPRISRRMISKSLLFGLPIMISTFFGIIINFGDKYLLEKFVDYKDLSIYYLAIACAGIISLLSNSLQNVWLPVFFKEKDISLNIAKTKKMIVRLVIVLVLLSAAIFMAVATLLWLHVIPNSYQSVIWILPILLAGQIVVCVALLYSNYLVYFEKTKIVLWTGLFVSVISVTLNLLLIPRFTIYGAAITLLVSNTLYLIIYSYCLTYYQKNFNQNMRITGEGKSR